MRVLLQKNRKFVNVGLCTSSYFTTKYGAKYFLKSNLNFCALNTFWSRTWISVHFQNYFELYFQSPLEFLNSRNEANYSSNKITMTWIQISRDDEVCIPSLSSILLAVQTWVLHSNGIPGNNRFPFFDSIQWNLDLRKILGVTKIFLRSRFFLISNKGKSLIT